MKNAFDMLINRLDIIDERISELENASIKTSKTEKQREQTLSLLNEDSWMKYLKGKKEAPTLKSVVCEIILQEWKRNKDFPRQTKKLSIFSSRHAFKEYVNRSSLERWKL